MLFAVPLTHVASLPPSQTLADWAKPYDPQITFDNASPSLWDDLAHGVLRSLWRTANIPPSSVPSVAFHDTHFHARV